MCSFYCLQDESVCLGRFKVVSGQIKGVEFLTYFLQYFLRKVFGFQFMYD